MSGETKAKITEGALELFSQNGYPGTSMSDIAARLHITKPALYKHYAGKHEILESIVRRMSSAPKVVPPANVSERPLSSSSASA